MADLTPLDEKLAEVLGLAQAAQTVTGTVIRQEDPHVYGVLPRATLGRWMPGAQ